jgi:hypothetical protein
MYVCSVVLVLVLVPRSCGPVVLWGSMGGRATCVMRPRGGEGMPPHTPLAQYETDGGEGLPLPPLAQYNICDRRSWKRGGAEWGAVALRVPVLLPSALTKGARRVRVSVCVTHAGVSCEQRVSVCV